MADDEDGPGEEHEGPNLDGIRLLMRENIEKLTTRNLAVAMGLDPDRLTPDERETIRLVRLGRFADSMGLVGEVREHFMTSHRPRPVTPGFYKPPRRPPGPRPVPPPAADPAAATVPETFDDLMRHMVVNYLVPLCIEDGIPLAFLGLEGFAPALPEVAIDEV